MMLYFYVLQGRSVITLKYTVYYDLYDFLYKLNVSK